MSSENPKKAKEARKLTEALRDLLLELKSHFEEEIRAAGVTLAQFRLLKAVEAHQDASAASLARVCGVTPQTLHTMLARAVREGWIVRGSTERNQRIVTASLTATGRQVLEEGRALQAQLEKTAWEGVGAATLRDTRTHLEAGLRNLRQSSPPQPHKGHPRP